MVIRVDIIIANNKSLVRLLGPRAVTMNVLPLAVSLEPDSRLLCLQRVWHAAPNVHAQHPLHATVHHYDRNGQVGDYYYYCHDDCNVQVQLQQRRCGWQLRLLLLLLLSARLSGSTLVSINEVTLHRTLLVGLLQGRVNIMGRCGRCHQLECGPMPNVMAALLNIGGALCSTPQSLADAHYIADLHSKFTLGPHQVSK